MSGAGGELPGAGPVAGFRAAAFAAAMTAWRQRAGLAPREAAHRLGLTLETQSAVELELVDPAALGPSTLLRIERVTGFGADALGTRAPAEIEDPAAEETSPPAAGGGAVARPAASTPPAASLRTGAPPEGGDGRAPSPRERADRLRPGRHARAIAVWFEVPATIVIKVEPVRLRLAATEADVLEARLARALAEWRLADGGAA